MHRSSGRGGHGTGRTGTGAGVAGGADTTDPAAPFLIDLTGLDPSTDPPTRDPAHPAYPLTGDRTAGRAAATDDGVGHLHRRPRRPSSGWRASANNHLMSGQRIAERTSALVRGPSTRPTSCVPLLVPHGISRVNRMRVVRRRIREIRSARPEAVLLIVVPEGRGGRCVGVRIAAVVRHPYEDRARQHACVNGRTIIAALGSAVVGLHKPTLRADLRFAIAADKVPESVRPAFVTYCGPHPLWPRPRRWTDGWRSADGRGLPR